MLTEPPLTVLHVITGLGSGGAEAMLANLVLAPRPGAPRAIVVSLLPGGPVRTRLEAGRVTVRDLGMTRGWPSPGAVLRLRGLIREERPDVVQSWLYHADLMVALALWTSGRRGRTPLAWGVRCSDMDVRRYSRALRAVIGVCARLSRLPDVVTVNSDAGLEVHRRLGYRARRFVRLDNGIDTERFRPDGEARRALRSELGIPNDAPVLVHVARLDPMKDHDTLLEAWRRLDGVHLIAVGAGTEALPERPGLHRIGRTDDVARVLAAGDLTVLSSAFGEGFSNALAEGMASGLLPVATDVGDARRIVGDTGLVVPPRDPGALADAVRCLLAEPPEARAARGAAARARIASEFSLARAVAAFDGLHRELARRA